MKMIKISMLALALGLMSFSAIAPVQSLVSETTAGDTASTIVWKAETIDVGQIPQGTPKVIVYEFKNTGKTAGKEVVQVYLSAPSKSPTEARARAL